LTRFKDVSERDGAFPEKSILAEFVLIIDIKLHDIVCSDVVEGKGLVKGCRFPCVGDVGGGDGGVSELYFDIGICG
jgi:hypothetical protein